MKKSKLTALAGTLLFHLLVVLLLFLLHLSMPSHVDEGGVPVMLGNTPEATGDVEPYNLTEVDVQQEPTVAEPEQPTPDEPVITQEDEPSLKIRKTEAKSDTKPKPKPETKQTSTVKKAAKPIEKKKEPTAEELAASQAAGRIAGAFGRGRQLGSSGNADSGKGTQGSLEGNASSGNTTGVGGYGTFDLNGRSLGSALPVPTYNVQDEGRVVVTIVVNPEGRVVRTSIHKRTNTTNPVLRRAAEEAARRARFNAIDGVNDQTGTITYYFRLR